MWNQQVQTDRTIPNNKPDIIIRNNEKGTCMLIEVAIWGARNGIKNEAKKIVKYKDLTIEIQRMWNVKAKVIPVTIGATGIVSESFGKREQHTRKSWSQGTTQYSHIGHHTYCGNYWCKSTVDSTLKLTI